MIVVKRKDRVYIAYQIMENTRFCDAFLSTKSSMLKDNLFFWEIPGKENAIMAGDLSMFGNDIMRYREDLFENCDKIDDEYCYFTLQKKIDDIVTEYPTLMDSEEDNRIYQRYIIAQDNRAFYYDNKVIKEIRSVYATEGYNEYLNLININEPDIPFVEVIKQLNFFYDNKLATRLYPLIYTDTYTKEVKLLTKNGTIKNLYKL